jgi:hypothetical protein
LEQELEGAEHSNATVCHGLTTEKLIS